MDYVSPQVQEFDMGTSRARKSQDFQLLKTLYQ